MPLNADRLVNEAELSGTVGFYYFSYPITKLSDSEVRRARQKLKERKKCSFTPCSNFRFNDNLTCAFHLDRILASEISLFKRAKKKIHKNGVFVHKIPFIGKFGIRIYINGNREDYKGEFETREQAVIVRDRLSSALNYSLLTTPV